MREITYQRISLNDNLSYIIRRKKILPAFLFAYAAVYRRSAAALPSGKYYGERLEWFRQYFEYLYSYMADEANPLEILNFNKPLNTKAELQSSRPPAGNAVITAEYTPSDLNF